MHRPTAARDKAILLTLRDTGLRVSGFCRLASEDLNLQTGELMVRPYRNSRKSRGRTVYLRCKARKAIWIYLRFGEGGDALFLTTEDRPFRRRAVHQLVSRLGKRAGIAGAHPHWFRHTFFPPVLAKWQRCSHSSKDSWSLNVGDGQETFGISGCRRGCCTEAG